MEERTGSVTDSTPESAHPPCHVGNIPRMSQNERQSHAATLRPSSSAPSRLAEAGRGRTRKMEVRKRPKSTGEEYSPEKSSEGTQRAQMKLGRGARANIVAGDIGISIDARHSWLLPWRRGMIRTDKEGQPVAPEGAGEDDEEERDGEHEREEDDGCVGAVSRARRGGAYF